MIPSQEMNTTQFTQVNNNSNSTILHLPTALNGKLDSSAYAINFELAEGNQLAFSSLSDYSLALIDVESLKPTVHIPQAHAKKIMNIFIGEDHCYSCSTDGSVKVWDLKEKKPLVATFRTPSQAEVYSVGQAKHVVAGGGQGIIHFWDMRNKKPMAEFGESHPDEISSLQFFRGKANKLLTTSIDGMVCQFDLKKESEEEATETVIMLQQAINTCRFFEQEDRGAYALTTANTIVVMSLEEARILRDYNTILNYETNENSLIDAYTKANDSLVYYLSANITGKIEEYALNASSQDQATLIKLYNTAHNGPVNMVKKLNDDIVLSCGEDGTFQITQMYVKSQNIDFQRDRSEMFIEDEGANEFLV